MEYAREIILSWMIATVSNNGVERLDDLHIDKISQRPLKRSEWISFALRSLSIASKLRDANQLDVTVAVGISLEARPAPIGVDFQNEADLVSQLSWSPPSLYLFHRTGTPWFGAIELDAERIGFDGICARCFYFELQCESKEEYSRSLFLAC